MVVDLDSLEGCRNQTFFASNRRKEAVSHWKAAGCWEELSTIMHSVSVTQDICFGAAMKKSVKNICVPPLRFQLYDPIHIPSFWFNLNLEGVPSAPFWTSLHGRAFRDPYLDNVQRWRKALVVVCSYSP